MRSGTRRPPDHRKRLPTPHQLSVDYPFVPVPTAFFDVLPSLSGSEAKVLLCVLRQTAGWRTQSGERKQSDWISQSQFKAKTGLASAAISRAIDALVRQGLLLADDGMDNLLSSAADRRRHRGKVYFGAAAGLQNSRPVGTKSERGVRKANGTKESSLTKELFPMRGTSCRAARGEGEGALLRAPAPQSTPLPKATVREASDLSGDPVTTGRVDRAHAPLEEEQRLRTAKERCRQTLRTIARK